MPTKTTTTIRACLLLLAGGFAAQHSRLPLGSDYCLWLLVAATVMLLLRRCRGVALLLLGFGLFMQAGNKIVDARLDARFAGDSMKVRVRITDFPKKSGASVILPLQPLADTRIPARSRVTWFEPSQIPRFGEVWELELRLRRPRGSSNPGVFSLENWMFREHLHGSGYVVPGHRNRLIRAAELGPIDTLRDRFVRFVTDNGGHSAAVLAAIGVGARHLISREQWSRYASTGTSHLMAISGLHIGLAASSSFLLVMLLSGLLRLPGNHFDRGILAGVFVACAYAVVSGLAVPSRRAAVMLALVALALLLRRPPIVVRIVALVAMLLFIVSPVSMMQPGFSLSFAAVTVLLWFARSHRRLRPNPPARIPAVVTALQQLLAMQGFLLLGLMPLTVVLFSRAALLAPLVNLVAVPVFSLVTVPLTLLSMVLLPIAESAAVLLLTLADRSVVAIEKVIDLFLALPMSDGLIATAGLNWCVVALPALWVLLPRAWPGRWLAMLGVLAILIHKPSTPTPDCFELQVLDVGQGLAVVVQSHRRTLLFDTGAAFRGGGSAASQVILPYLLDRGVDTIDWLVVSHADNDHAGGVAAITAELPVRQTYLGEPVANFELNSQPCEAGQTWVADGIEFRFWHPLLEHRSGNDSSCVLSLSVGNYRVLLTGDIEAAGERALLSRLASPADVVIIPHHGSLTSSSLALVNRLQPTYAIASAAFNNRWGFPKQRVVSRWQGVGATVLNTATDGAIGMQVCAEGGITDVRRERVRQRRFWHDRGLR